MREVLVRGVSFIAILCGFSHSAIAQRSFECPEMIDGQTVAQRAEIKRYLPLGDAMNDPVRLNNSIDGLRKLGLSKALIINHLIGAYCPLVAQNRSLSFSSKTARVRHFASQVTALVYSEEGVSEIILNVPLTPSVVDAVNAKATKAGVPIEVWLSRKIEAAAQQP